MEGKLGANRGDVEKYNTYYDAEEQVLAFAQRKFREEFGYLFADWRDNFCGVVVDSMTERMRIDGFRWGDEPDADKDAQKIWQANYLDAESVQAHTDALVAGAAYLTVWGDEEDQPLIVPESALHMAVQYEPGSRRKLSAALKKYFDDWGQEHVTLWTPDTVYTTTRGHKDSFWGEPETKENPLGIVPVVPLWNRPRLSRDKPWSELKPIVPIQQAISKIVADLITASEFNAYPQRIISGIELPEDDEGNTTAPLQAAIDRLLLFEEENVKWGQFSAADLANYETAITMLVMHLASISRTPSHYFAGGGGMSSNSGEFTQSREAGLVNKVRDRELHFGEGWERAMRLGFLVKGDEAKAKETRAETIWADPEYRSEGQKIDGLIKLNQIGVPMRQLWEDAGYSPPQIARFSDMQEAEFKLKVEQQKVMAEAMPQQPGAPGQPGAKPKPQPGNSGNDNRKNSGKAA
ncbi:phage portal protein [Nonomuraea zeae]|uniref:phage portal protein n=1 Tax=Nonomuraea zeae TaxID=1642303 RepID=UPI003611CA70